MVKPVPASVAALMVTAAVPVELKVTDCVADVFNTTLPKEMLVALMLKVGVNAFNCKAKLFETAPALAVSVTAWAVPTDDTAAVNPALVALAGTVTVVGTVTAPLLLDRLTLSPPLGAAPLNVIVHASVTDPVSDALLQERLLNVAVAPPLPCTLTIAAVLDEALVMIPNSPAEFDAKLDAALFSTIALQLDQARKVQQAKIVCRRRTRWLLNRKRFT